MPSLLILSHSPKVAEGIRELAGEMGRKADIHAVGGQKDGSFGADYDKTKEVLAQALKSGPVIILFDLGSTLMTVQMIIDEFSEEDQKNVYLSDAALAEGAIVAAVGLGADMPVESIVEELNKLSLNKL